jgi:simple sugar transport system ATP-binding protein
MRKHPDTARSAPHEVVTLERISKRFGSTQAVKDVSLTFRAGEVHAVLGENGAGKSTLIKIMTGAAVADAGELRLDGRRLHLASPADARAAGIGAVYQEVNLVATLTVAQNLTLGRLPRRFGLVDWRAARRRAAERMKRLGIEIDVERPLGAYSIAIQQLVAIARALEDDTRVLVLDEPTASLDAAETARLLDIVRDLRSRGLAIVFISHFLDQVYAIADRLTVLRNGRRVGVGSPSEIPLPKLVPLMLGRELEAVESLRDTTGDGDLGEPILVAEGLGKSRVMAPFDLTLRAGEAVGLSGLLGAGRTESAKLVFGALRASAGAVKVDGEKYSPTPRASLSRGVAFCPEDRKAEGIFAELSIRENIVIALQSKRGWLKALSRAEQQRLADEMILALGVATPDAEKPVGQLSGGNQQKTVLARALVADPRVLILDEPTRGIDVGAHAEIVALIRRLTRDGLAILVASSELEELIAVSHRVAVLRDRAFVGELVGADINQAAIMRTIAAP